MVPVVVSCGIKTTDVYTRGTTHRGATLTLRSKNMFLRYYFFFPFVLWRSFCFDFYFVNFNRFNSLN